MPILRRTVRIYTIALFGCLPILAGCSTTGSGQIEPIIRTVEVQTPVAKSCVPETLGESPEYPDSDTALKLASNAAERYLLIIAGRTLRIAREAELSTVVKACK